jgi:hypothetical protein
MQGYECTCSMRCVKPGRIGRDISNEFNIHVISVQAEKGVADHVAIHFSGNFYHALLHVGLSVRQSFNAAAEQLRLQQIAADHPFFLWPEDADSRDFAVSPREQAEAQSFDFDRYWCRRSTSLVAPPPGYVVTPNIDVHRVIASLMAKDVRFFCVTGDRGVGKSITTKLVRNRVLCFVVLCFVVLCCVVLCCVVLCCVLHRFVGATCSWAALLSHI